MGAWARDQKTNGKVRMLADGSADFTKATGLTLDLTARGMGLRSNRYSMLIVAALNIEGPGKFEVRRIHFTIKMVRLNCQIPPRPMRYNTYATHLVEEILQSRGVYGPASLYERSPKIVTLYFNKGTYPLSYYSQARSALLESGWELQEEVMSGEPIADEEFLIQPVRYM